MAQDMIQELVILFHKCLSFPDGAGFKIKDSAPFAETVKRLFFTGYQPLLALEYAQV
jgi:hypothetical protein